MLFDLVRCTGTTFGSSLRARQLETLFFSLVAIADQVVCLFTLCRREADQTGNCPSGLVVDREVVHSKYTDFYLQSQPGLKGSKSRRRPPLPV